MSFIKIQNVKKRYPMGKTIVHALRGISLDIPKGEFLCLGGASGSGKSTLLNIIGLLDDPSEGYLFFDDIDTSALSPKELHKFRRNRIAFIFQSFNLIPVLTARENIEFPLLIQKVPKSKRKLLIDQLSEEVGILEYLDHKPDELSGGQRQRVAIARALVTNPEVILADEPTANLDSKTGKTILELLRRMNREKGTTIIIASHDKMIMDEANIMINIVDGKIDDR